MHHNIYDRRKHEKASQLEAKYSLTKRAVSGQSGALKAFADGRLPDARRWMAGAEHLYRPIKKPVTLRLDADVLMWFKAQGRGYKTRINRILRGLMLKSRKPRD
jgi:uncharacterized protein (DUF4415 family)